MKVEGSDGADWLTSSKFVKVITDPVQHYIHTHSAGLPVTADLLYKTWAGVLLILLVLAFCGSWGARIGWTIMGVLSTGMVWEGAAHSHRAIAAGLTGPPGRCCLYSLFVEPGGVRITPPS